VGSHHCDLLAAGGQRKEAFFKSSWSNCCFERLYGWRRVTPFVTARFGSPI
jgi:hypothetical protein